MNPSPPTFFLPADRSRAAVRALWRLLCAVVAGGLLFQIRPDWALLWKTQPASCLALAILALCLAIVALALLVAAGRWLLLAVWPGPLGIHATAGGLVLSLGPLGRGAYAIEYDLKGWRKHLAAYSCGKRENLLVPINYQSKVRLFGIPLLHIAIGSSTANRVFGRRGVAKGWIAFGDISFGVLFSCGGLAIGGIAFGGIALGVFSLAGVAIGVLAVGGLGLAAFESYGGAAVAGYAAKGGLAAAFIYAQGDSAVADHANDAAANAFFGTDWFGSVATWCGAYGRWALLLVLLPIVVTYFQRLRRSTENPV